jgi:SAM-dependent methyltransferase
MQSYNADFFRKEHEMVLQSARQVVPIIIRLLKPQRVVDVGCGTGVWLSVFGEHGVEDFVGIDGAYVDPASLNIPRDRFLTRDLSQPFDLNREFDLAVSLEVAEHLPAASAAGFVESLTKLAAVVLFSAAIPFQGGVNHVNEQWPEYWVKLFAGRGYTVIDCIRRRIWDNEHVAYYYAQNMLIFCRRDVLQNNPLLRTEQQQGVAAPLSMVHPKKLLELIEWQRQLHAAAADLKSVLPAGEKLVLVDEEQIRGVIAAGYRALPFLEHDGQYWGRPADDKIAIEELERMRNNGARFIAVAWPAFWWLGHYAEFHRHLRQRYRLVLENERLVIFDLS